MKFLLLLLSPFYCFICCGQAGSDFKPLRFEEDYTRLVNDSSRNIFERIKYLPLANQGRSYFSLGGEARAQYFFTKNEAWGELPPDNNGYVLSRLLFHADFHAGPYFRTFVQLQSSLVISRPVAGPVEQNPLDLHQVFTDINFDLSAADKFILRVGRQELLYGSQRLVSVRDGPNNRQAFDGIKSILQGKNYRGELFYSHYVIAQKGVFDDGFNKDVKFWGVYFVRNKIPLFKNLDLYYFGIWKRNATFDDGTGSELRHSTGFRVWNKDAKLFYDIEALFQFGKLADKDIHAWTASVNLSYRISQLKWIQEIGIKSELISGDRNYHDKKLGTFNPLYPRGGYFGLAALIGPVNLTDLHPYISLRIHRHLNFDLDYDIFWRHQRNDGVYAVNVAMIYSGKNIEPLHIGSQLSGTMIFQPNHFLYFRYECSWFKAGSFLKQAGPGKDILFTGVTAQLKF